MNNKLVNRGCGYAAVEQAPGLPGYESTYIGSSDARSWSPPRRGLDLARVHLGYVCAEKRRRETFRPCLSSRVRILCVCSASYRLTLYPYTAAHTYAYTYTRTCTRIQYGPPPAGVKSTGQQAKRRSITGDLGGSAPRSVFRGIQTVLVIALKYSGEEGGSPFRMNSTFQESMKY